MTRGLALKLPLQLAFLLGGVQALFAQAGYAAALHEFDGKALAIVIRHVGQQDRAVPRLVVYSGNKADFAQGFDCARSTACFAVSAAVLDRLACSLNSRLSSQLHDDRDIEQAGSFEFSIEGNKARKALSMNKRHSSEVLRDLIELVTDSAIRREFERRLSIAGI